MTEKINDSPDLASVIRVAFQSMIAGVHVAMPGRVENWDPETQRADVKPLIKRVFYTFERERRIEPLPVIPRVPVIFPRSDQTFISFPLAAGSHVLLLFNERSIDQFMGRDGSDTDPLDVRSHDLSDAVALAGFYPDEKALADVDPDNIVIGRDGGGMQLHVTPDNVAEFRVEGTADMAVAIAEELKTYLDQTLKQWLTTHTHTSAAPGSPSSPPVQVGAFPAYNAAITSNKLKVKGN